MTEQFSPDEIQAIERFLDAGIFLSAEKLAAMSGTTWDIVSSSVQELPVIRVISMFHQDQETCYGVHMQSSSALPAQVLVFFKEPSVRRLTAAVVSRSKGLQGLPEPERAVIPEISNIIGQAVLKSIADSLKIRLVLSVPALHVGKKSVIFTEAIGKLEGHEETAVLMRLDMSSGKVAAECSLALVLHVKLMSDLIRKASEA